MPVVGPHTDVRTWYDPNHDCAGAGVRFRAGVEGQTKREVEVGGPQIVWKRRGLEVGVVLACVGRQYHGYGVGGVRIPAVGQPFREGRLRPHAQEAHC
jgi:hypothetical protein